MDEATSNAPTQPELTAPNEHGDDQETVDDDFITFAAADTNADGVVTSLDALRVINHPNRAAAIESWPVLDSADVNGLDVNEDQSILAAAALNVLLALYGRKP